MLFHWTSKPLTLYVLHCLPLQTKGVLEMPNKEFWKQVGGLAKDGFMYTQAKASGKEYSAVPDVPAVAHMHAEVRTVICPVYLPIAHDRHAWSWRGDSANCAGCRNRRSRCRPTRSCPLKRAK